ncbi:MAG: type II secretion system protein GspC [Gammaproteobacteria bacterium]|nr:MAG: type II secretion system protein GspC [Gammaproteobacteria bacterium]
MAELTLNTLQHYALPVWSAFTHRIGKERLLGMLNLSAVIVLSWGAAQWTWQLAEPRLPNIVVRPALTENATQKLDTQALLNANLFGKVEAIGISDVSPTEVPLSSLNLVLTGVVAAGDASIALISVDGQPQTPFTIGEVVAHGASLQTVYPDRAILQRAGVLESLVLEDVAKSLPSQSVSVINPRTVAADRIQQLGDNNYVVPRNIIGEQLKNPDFLRQAHIVQYKDGGFLVKHIKRGSLYEKLGLQKGDVIKNVNGEPLNSVADAMSHYQKLNTLGQVQIEVTRNGQSQVLQFHLE